MRRAALYVLDTNTVSYLINGRSAQVRKTVQQRAAGSVLAISAITEAEVRYGLARKPGAARLRALVEEMLGNLRVMAWDSAAAAAYAELRADMTDRGKTLAALDMLIAAHAISLNAVLVTADAAFAHCGSTLRRENWATDL